MREMQIIVTDDRGVCLSVCPSSRGGECSVCGAAAAGLFCAAFAK